MHIKKAVSLFFEQVACALVSMQMITYNSLLFSTLSIAYVTLIKMYYNGSLLNNLTPTTFRH